MPGALSAISAERAQHIDIASPLQHFLVLTVI